MVQLDTKKNQWIQKLSVLTVVTFINFTYDNSKLNQLKFNPVFLDFKKE